MAWPLLLWGVLSLLPAAARPGPLASDGSAAPTVVVTLAAVLPERDARSPWAWPRVGPALSLALEALEPQLGPAGLAVRTVFASAEQGGACSQDVARLKTVELKAAHDPDVLLGLGCGYRDPQLEKWAKEWGLPFLAAGDHDGRFDYTTMVYLGPMGRGLQPFLNRLDWHLNWPSPWVFVFSLQERDFPQYFYDRRLEEQRRDSHVFLVRSDLDDHLDEALRFVRAHGRVVYINGSPEMLQKMMRLAQAQNMTNGDYVFIYLDILGESLEAEGHREAAKPWQNKQNQDVGGLQEAFQVVLIVTSHKPQTRAYKRFQSELIQRAQRDFGVVLNDSLHKNLVAGCFHDGLLLYIRALNETLREGGTKRNTSRILEKMKNLKIQGVTGSVSIDQYKERETDFDLWSIADAERGQYQVVARYLASAGRIKWLRHIHWKERVPLLDRPPCGFNMDDPSCGMGACVEG